jgi:hypothetical protein
MAAAPTCRQRASKSSALPKKAASPVKAGGFLLFMSHAVAVSNPYETCA